jgi:type I restriction enzyme R subunit
MNKRALTEADIRTKFITPALVGANGDKWDVMTQIREEAHFTKDHLLPEYKNLLVQIAETRDKLRSQLMDGLSRA